MFRGISDKAYENIPRKLYEKKEQPVLDLELVVFFGYYSHTYLFQPLDVSVDDEN